VDDVEPVVEVLTHFFALDKTGLDEYAVPGIGQRAASSHARGSTTAHPHGAQSHSVLENVHSPNRPDHPGHPHGRVA
jgi:hypothetical protein